jgi:hypothetical protein
VRGALTIYIKWLSGKEASHVILDHPFQHPKTSTKRIVANQII